MPEVQPEQISHQYRVRKVSDLKPLQSVEGHIACAQDSGPSAFVNAVESLGDRVEDGVIGVIAGEFSYGGGSVMVKLLNEGVVFNGLLTFGGIGASDYRGWSHLSIVARDLEIPLCIAKRPFGYIRPSKEFDWLENGVFSNLHSRLGSLTLSKNSRKIEIRA